MECRIEIEENGDYVLDLSHIIESSPAIEWQVGDVISFNIQQERVFIKNESFKSMPLSRYRRDLTGICRKFSDKSHPLKRILITINKESKFVALAYDEYDLPIKFINDTITAKKESDAGMMTPYEFDS